MLVLAAQYWGLDRVSQFLTVYEVGSRQYSTAPPYVLPHRNRHLVHYFAMHHQSKYCLQSACFIYFPFVAVGRKEA